MIGYGRPYAWTPGPARLRAVRPCRRRASAVAGSGRAAALALGQPPGAVDRPGRWTAGGAGLGPAGGRRGRRAAIRGIASIGITSLVVNQGIKRVVQRPRP